MSNDLIVNGEEIEQIKSKLTGLSKDNGTKNAELKNVETFLVQIIMGDVDVFKVFKMAYQLWGIITKKQIAEAVQQKAITIEQYEDITGEKFVSEETKKAND